MAPAAITAPGLEGLEDRVSALDSRLVVKGPAGEGTSISAQLPIADLG